MEDKRAERLGWVLILFWFGLGLWYKRAFWQRTSPVSLGDLYFYQGLAQAFLQRDWPHFWHFHFYPGYPVLMAVFSRSSGANLIVSALWLNLIFDSLSIVPIYLIARSLYGRRAGLFAAIFWALSGAKVKIYGDPEPVYGFFVFLGLVLMFKNPLRRRHYLIAVTLAAFAGLIKSEAMLFVFFFSLMFLVRSPGPVRAKILALTTAAAIYLAVSSPLWVKYYSATGQFNPNPKSRTLFFIHNYQGHYQTNLYGLKEDAEGLYSNAQRIYIEGDRRPIRNSIFSYAWENRKLFGWSYLDKLNFALEKDLLYLLLRIFPGAVALSLIYWVRRRLGFNLDREAWLWFWGLAVLLSVSLFDPWERFFYTFFPVLVIISASGLDRLVTFADRNAQRFYRQSLIPRMVKWSVMGLFLLWYAGYNLVGLFHAAPDQFQAALFKAKAIIAKQIKPELDPAGKVMCRGFPEPITYFLDLPFWQMVITPYGKQDELLSYARESGARYLFFEQDDLNSNPLADQWVYGEVEARNLKLLQRISRELKDEYYPYALYELQPATRSR